jgi:hypothetical protein
MLTRLIRITLGGGVALLLLLAAAIEPVLAGGAGALTCFRTRGSVSCVAQWGASRDPHIRQIPGARDAEEDAAIAEREKRWVARCRPVVRQDQYGVGRYHYAAPGCEYGVMHD